MSGAQPGAARLAFASAAGAGAAGAAVTPAGVTETNRLYPSRAKRRATAGSAATAARAAVAALPAVARRFAREGYSRFVSVTPAGVTAAPAAPAPAADANASRAAPGCAPDIVTRLTRPIGGGGHFA